MSTNDIELIVSSPEKSTGYKRPDDAHSYRCSNASTLAMLTERAFRPNCFSNDSGTSHAACVLQQRAGTVGVLHTQISDDIV
jgi:hypothetical protein